MKRKKYPTEKVDKALFEYKQQPDSETLLILYEALDPIIANYAKLIAYNFSQKNPEDFEDIVQNIKIEVFRFLKKLADMSTSGDQIISIVVHAVKWQFNVYYRRYKRHKNLIYRNNSELVYTEEGEPHYNEDVGYNLDKKHKDWQQENVFVLNNFIDFTLEHMLELNRFKDKNSLIEFCYLSLLENREPSSNVIFSRWGEKASTFWIGYTKVLLKLTLLKYNVSII